MIFPYTISVWCKDLGSAMQLINDHALGNQLVQLVMDQGASRAYWAVLRVTGDQWQAWKENPLEGKLANGRSRLPIIDGTDSEN